MGQIFTSPKTLGEVLKHEYSRETCREVVTLVAKADGYPVGSVLGKVTASGKYKMATATGTDGAEKAAAVLLIAVDGSSTDISNVLVLVRGPAIVADTGLEWDASVNTDALKKAKHQQLADLGIAVREAV